MGKIKFRIYHKDRGMIKINRSFEFDDEGELLGGIWELMQFTGLFDKNGKEIYEGDIWKMEIPEEDGGDVYGSVVFYEGSFMRVEGIGTNGAEELQWSSDFGTGVVSDIEIVGNIYEHSNLLNK